MRCSICDRTRRSLQETRFENWRWTIWSKIRTVYQKDGHAGRADKNETLRDLTDLALIKSAAFRVMLFAAALAASLIVRPASSLAADEWQPSPVLQELLHKAKAEKEVTIWSSGPDPIAWINAAFSKRFPGIEVKTLA